MSKTHKKKPIPEQMLLQYDAEYPDAWKRITEIRALRGKLYDDFPQWCYIPIAATISMYSTNADYQNEAEVVLDKVGQARDATALAALSAWRVSKGVYRFDATLYDALINQPLQGELPVEVFFKLPEWCVYIETPGIRIINIDVNGAYVWLEYDIRDGSPELRLLLINSDMSFTPAALILSEKTLSAMMDKLLESSKETRDKILLHMPEMAAYNSGEYYASLLDPKIQSIIQLVLYLCSTNADMPKIPPPGHRFTRPKHEPAAFQPRVWDVGTRIGAAIRKHRIAEETASKAERYPGDGSSKRPHVRRAHWHHYRVGAGRKDVILKWLPPIPINIMEDMPVTVRPVKED